MTLEQLIQRELDHGTRVFTLDDVLALAEQWRAEKRATAEPFDGLKSDAEIDALLGIQQSRTLDTPAAYSTVRMDEAGL